MCLRLAKLITKRPSNVTTGSTGDIRGRAPLQALAAKKAPFGLQVWLPNIQI